MSLVTQQSANPHPMHRVSVDATCVNCGRKFRVPVSRIKRGGGKFCSVNCFREYWKSRVLPARRNHLNKRQSLTISQTVKR